MRLSVLAALVAVIVGPSLARAGVALPTVATPACTTSGSGLTLTTTAPLHYVPAGGSLTVSAAAAAGEIRYTVRERTEVLAGVAAAPSTVAASAAGVALTLPATVPGFYEVAAQLVVSGAVVAQSCLTYGVGAVGSTFDPASLPAGADWGGPGPERSIAIHDALGFSDVRLSIDFASLFRTGKLDASAYDVPFARAAARAAAAGISFHVQVGQNGPGEVAAVKDGTWENKVEQLVRHFAGVVPAWEAWNEPDAFFEGPASSYVKNVLAPFNRAVRRADPKATVIGASTLGYNSYWFNEFARSGGFALVDVVAIHPYTADNRSWTEQGTAAMFTQLRALMARNGAGSKPIWNTESAWWSTGDYNLYTGASRTAESLILARTMNVKMAAFLIEGGWQDWSLIDPRTGVKPAALAAINTKVQLGSRRFLGFANSGMPHTTVARFDGVTVVWSDRLSVPATVSGASASFDVLGRPLGAPSRITITGQPTYLIGNATVRAAAPGTNVARGAVVKASSGTGAAGAVDGRTDNADRGDTTSAWIASSSDARPTLTLTLAKAATVRSILVATPSSGSVVPGVRDYTIALRDARGVWHNVATKRGQVWDRMALLTVKPQTATAVRLTVQAVNDSGIRQCWPGEGVTVLTKARAQAVVQEIEVYGTVLPIKR